MTVLKTERSSNPVISQEQLGRLGVLLREERFPELEDHCHTLLKLEPSNFSLYHILGLSQSGQRKYSEAIESYRKFLRQRPDYADAKINLGIALNKTGDTEGALSTLHEALKLTPGNAVIHDLIGDIYTMCGRLEEAQDCFEEAIRLSPDNAVYLNRLGTVLNNLGEYEEAEVQLRKSIELNKGLGVAHRNLGTVLRNMGRIEEAIAYFGVAAKLTPRDTEVYNNLGGAHFLQGKYEDAIRFHLHTLKLEPHNDIAYGNLGAAYHKNGQLKQALDCYGASLAINPAREWVLVNLSETLAIVRDHSIVSEKLLVHIIRCFRMPNVESLSVSKAALSLVKRQAGFDFDNGTVSLEMLAQLDDDCFELLLLLVSETLIPDMKFEAVLARLRKLLLSKFTDKGILTEREIDLAEALAYQGNKNEYLWWQSSLEIEVFDAFLQELKQDIRQKNKQDAVSLFLAGCYIPIHADDVISECAHKIYDEEPQSRIGRFVSRMVVEPLAYKAQMREVPQLTSVEDAVSKAVQGQYEQNPYPSWESLSQGQSKLYTEKIRMEILPNSPDLVYRTKRPSILIAGCGTGKHAIMTAMTNKDSDVLALDLSYASLGYAKWSADKFGIENIRFGQGDLLRLEEIGEDFDVIESVGVLHHMSDPEAGLKSLLRYLKPDGYIKLGLYSDEARKVVKHLRQNTDIDDVELTARGIREYRHLLQLKMPKLFRAISGSRDFYTVSALRDLILHVQEQRFTIPRLKAMLDDNGLEFLGFVLRDNKGKLSYLEKYSADPTCTMLDNWEEFEKENPRTFGNMYQFWCRKMQ